MTHDVRVGYGCLVAAVLAASSGCTRGGASGTGPLAGAAPSPAAGTASGALPASREVLEGRFATALVCARCHSNAPAAAAMRDASGAAVGPFDLWRASPMANAARDPFWRAQVAVEVATNPSRALDVQAKCLRCHAPLASTEAELNGEPAPTVALLETDTARGQLALDGASCTLCHQVQPGNLGQASSFTGGFQVGSAREVFGPHPLPFGAPMVQQTGFTPREGAHLGRSALCGTCHTLTTSALDAAGQATGHSVLEQAPYLEWRNSVFQDELSPGTEARSCQSCHLPELDASGRPIQTALARTPAGGDFAPLSPRSPFGRHLLLGGNTLLLAILRDQAATLQPLAPAAAFDAALAATRAQLRGAARLTLEAPSRQGDQLLLTARVENLTGHKLPTGYPSRRLWLRLTVRDGSGAVVFRSGDYDAAGRLVDGAGAPLASEAPGGAIPPHADLITASDQVQVWQAVLGDAAGRPTWLLLRAAGWAKDDRLLPRGWSAAHPDGPATAPVGVGGDLDFLAGEDRVHFRVQAPAAGGPYAIEAWLLFQPLDERTAGELFLHALPEVQAFRAYHAAADRRPELLASAAAQSF